MKAVEQQTRMQEMSQRWIKDEQTMKEEIYTDLDPDLNYIKDLFRDSKGV